MWFGRFDTIFSIFVLKTSPNPLTVNSTRNPTFPHCLRQLLYSNRRQPLLPMNSIMNWAGLGITRRDRARYDAFRALRNSIQTQDEQLALQNPRRLLDLNSQPQTPPQSTILSTPTPTPPPQPIRNVEASATQNPSTLVVDTDTVLPLPAVLTSLTNTTTVSPNTTSNVSTATAPADAEQERRVVEHEQQQNLQIENNVALPLSPVVVATVSFSSRHLILVFHNVNSISTFSFLFIAIVIFSHQEESDYHHLAS